MEKEDLGSSSLLHVFRHHQMLQKRHWRLGDEIPSFAASLVAVFSLNLIIQFLEKHGVFVSRPMMSAKGLGGRTTHRTAPQ